MKKEPLFISALFRLRAQSFSGATDAVVFPGAGGCTFSRVGQPEQSDAFLGAGGIPYLTQKVHGFPGAGEYTAFRIALPAGSCLLPKARVIL